MPESLPGICNLRFAGARLSEAVTGFVTSPRGCQTVVSRYLYVLTVLTIHYGTFWPFHGALTVVLIYFIFRLKNVCRCKTSHGGPDGVRLKTINTIASNGAPNKCNNAIQQAIRNGAHSCHVTIGSFQYQTGGLGF
jgi:hypothetical protein